MAYAVQRAAVVELGPDAGSLTDVTCDVSFFGVTVGRTTVVKAASFGSPAIEQRASALTGSVVMSFSSQPGSDIVNLMRAARDTVSGELYFRVKYQDAAVSPTNPSQTGWLTVTDFQLGAPVSSPMVQTQTFPARDVTEATA